MVVRIFMVVAIISFSVHGSLRITSREYPLMEYITLVSEEHFDVGRSLVIVIESTNNDVTFLIEKVHTAGRWPILVFNAAVTMKENMHVERHKHGNYILLISGPCQEWEEHISRFQQQLSCLVFGDMRKSWNPAAKFIVSVMLNCTHFNNTFISRAILHQLWFNGVVKATVHFMHPNEHGDKNVQQNTTFSAQGTSLELHTWYPYENSERCNPSEGTVPVKVFTARNLSDIRRSGLFKGYFGRNLHQCPLTVHATVNPPFVNRPKSFRYNNSEYYNVYEDGLEIQLLKIIGTSLNMSLEIKDGNEEDYRDVTPLIYIGGHSASHSSEGYEFTQSFLNVRFLWYTPCALKCQRWSRFFKIFSVDMWISFILSIVLAVFTVSCISYCGHKSHLHEFKSYGNILNIIANIISVSLSVSVSAQPRTSPLRLFFFCWVCYSVAISTVFQAYVTTYLIEPGYEEPIKTLDEMLKSERKFGFNEACEMFYANSSDPVDISILKDAARCPDYDTCFRRATLYHNISTILHDFKTESYSQLGNWTDENNRPLLCELEDGLVRTFDFVLLVNDGHPLLEYINDVIGRIVEGGILRQIKKLHSEKEKIESKFHAYTFDDTYSAINIKQLQTAFYLLLMGYVLALAGFVIEIMWHYCKSKRRETKRIYLSRADINRQLRSLSELNLRLYN